MGRPGPVFLELPPDILNISIPEQEAPLPKQPTRKYTVHPDDADLKQAADLINSAKQPLFLGGSGADSVVAATRSDSSSRRRESPSS